MRLSALVQSEASHWVLREQPLLWHFNGVSGRCCCRYRCLPLLYPGSRRTQRKIPGPWRRSSRGRYPSCSRIPAWVNRSLDRNHSPRLAGRRALRMKSLEASSSLGTFCFLQDVAGGWDRQQVLNSAHSSHALLKRVVTLGISLSTFDAFVPLLLAAFPAALFYCVRSTARLEVM